MKKLLVMVVMIAASLTGCSTAQQASTVSALSKLQAVVNEGCLVLQPTLTAIAAIDPNFSTVATANGLFCAGVGSMTVDSVQSILSTGIPAIETALTDSSLIPADKKPAYVAILGVFQLTLTNALAAYAGATQTGASS